MYDFGNSEVVEESGYTEAPAAEETHDPGPQYEPARVEAMERKLQQMAMVFNEGQAPGPDPVQQYHDLIVNQPQQFASLIAQQATQQAKNEIAVESVVNTYFSKNPQLREFESEIAEHVGIVQQQAAQGGKQLSAEQALEQGTQSFMTKVQKLFQEQQNVQQSEQMRNLSLRADAGSGAPPPAGQPAGQAGLASNFGSQWEAAKLKAYGY